MAAPFDGGNTMKVSECMSQDVRIANPEETLQEAARKMEEAQKSQDPAAIAAATGDAAKAAAGVLGGGQAIAAQSLKAALPEKLAGLPRTGFDVQDGAALGLPTSQARTSVVFCPSSRWRGNASSGQRNRASTPRLPAKSVGARWRYLSQRQSSAQPFRQG